MTHQIDASFRQRKQSFAAWRRRGRLRRLGAAAGVAVVLALAVGAYSVSDLWLPRDDLDEELQATELAGLSEDAPAYIPAIVDLAGDPLWITLDRDPGSQSKVKLIDRPADLDGQVPAKLEVLSDEMLSSSEQFMTTIPSSQEDFAFFQAQRAGGMPAEDPGGMAADDHSDLDGDAISSAPELLAAGAGETVDDVGAGWDELAEIDDAGPTQFQKTRIEDTTTVATVISESHRYEPTEDTFVRILGTRALESVVLEAGFEPAEAKLANESLASVFNRSQLEEGFVVALRGFRAQRGARSSLMQVSVYTRNTYVGTLARGEADGFEAGADPWVPNDLFNYSGLAVATGERQYRLLDAIYSTGVRNSVPAGVVGEAIVHLSRTNDLNLFADKSDRLTLIYSQEARGSGESAGRVLYVAVQGSGRSLECYVFQQPDGTFGCSGEAVGAVAASTGIATPVNGVLTSTFGPRKHPILKTVRLHKGVDWKAPTGTPILAAFDGEIAYRGDGKGYGNLIKMTHAGGRETRYAHMQRFADEVGLGATVKAGTVIGYVGTTGLSTGPHLHFEVYINGEPVDPLVNLVATVAVAAAPEIVVPAIAMSSDEQAVEILTNRIIHVESGGKATAKNPLSSATGLGQFISSTWLRMMRTYRPDLARSMSEKDLLALRFDPTISREMVKNLAREGEAYLKGRGHGITAGRLYLCHFLGMEGAHVVLAAPRSNTLVSLLGAGVIKANPFLTGKDAGYVIEWAERKMRSHKGTAVVTTSPSAPPAAPPVVVQLSPEFEKYRTSIGGILKVIAPAT
ncbi:MAG: peptidoglycan DD-metalloendopeptidase family protein [Rhizobiaceae bacterium]